MACADKQSDRARGRPQTKLGIIGQPDTVTDRGTNTVGADLGADNTADDTVAKHSPDPQTIGIAIVWPWPWVPERTG